MRFAEIVNREAVMSVTRYCLRINKRRTYMNIIRGIWASNAGGVIFIENNNKDVYCLFCVVGSEEMVIKNLQRLGYRALSPIVLRWKPINGKSTKRPSRLLPGYIFFSVSTDCALDWDSIRSIQKVLRTLQYDDGCRALRGSDYEFYDWLKRYEGVIDVSQVVQEGTKIRFVSGPLTELNGTVDKVSKSRKQFAVNLGDASAIRLVWCGIEYVEVISNEKH